MKKRDSIHVLLAAAALLLATASCTKDESADNDRLPEGQYPLTIAGITLGVEGGEAQLWGAPQTRVSETTNGTGSAFDEGDEFTVQIEGNTQTGIYAMQADGSVNAETFLYWSDRENHTVNAWYPTKSGSLDLSDQQTKGLVYLLHGTGTGNYQISVKLTFSHALAKVRVTPSDEALGKVQSLQLYTYTQCTYEKGLAGQGSQEDWIEMKRCEYTENGIPITCWEANVLPGHAISKLRANGTEERNLSAAIIPEAGKFYNITLNYDKGYTDDGEGNYTVTTVDGLKYVADLVNDGVTGINITLAADIDLSGINWIPIGTSYNNSYTGTFDGNGYRITGLTVTGSGNYVGLFGFIGEGGTVKNVKLEGVQIVSNHSSGSTGGVAGESHGTIENCSVSGSVSSNNSSLVGGVVGYQVGGSIIDCSSSATVKGASQIGGVAGGTNSHATLIACYATGDVTLDSNGIDNYNAGGVVGSNGVSTLIACYATGSVTGFGSGTIRVGGVTGTHDSRTLTACYHAKGNVSGPDGTTGGITGATSNAFEDPVITACYWGDNGQTGGIGENQAGTTGETTKVDGTIITWQTAVDTMNAALNGKGWQYELKDGNSLPTLKKQ